jgi:hypothetical protein
MITITVGSAPGTLVVNVEMLSFVMLMEIRKDTCNLLS